MNRRSLILLLLALFGAPCGVFAQVLFQNLAVQPAILCSGNPATVTFQAALPSNSTGSQNLYLYGTIDSSPTVSATSNVFIWSSSTFNGANVSTGSTTTLSPAWAATWWESPGAIPFANYNAYTAIITSIPAYANGTVVYITIGGADSYTSGYSETYSIQIPVTVNCTASDAINTGNGVFVNAGVTYTGQSNPVTVLISSAGCYTNTFTNTPTVTSTYTDTKTPTATFTATSTNTVTNTDTPTDTMTPTNTATPTMTHTPTNTVTNTDTPTLTNTQTNTDTTTPTNTLMNTATDTNTPTVTPTNTVTNTFTPTVTPTSTNTQTDTDTTTPTYTVTNTPTDTNTPVPNSTDTNTPTITDTDTVTNTVTVTDTVTSTNTPTDTNTPVPNATDTNTPTITSTNTCTNSATNTPSPTVTSTPTYTFTASPTSTPTHTATNTSTNTATQTCTNTFNNTATPTNSFTPTFTPGTSVSMGKQTSENQVHSGDVLTYSIGITVTGNNAAGVTVTDILPSNMTFVSFGKIPNGTVTFFNSSTGQLQWTLPSPLAPSVYTLTYQTQINNFAPANVALINSAQLIYPGLTKPLTSSVPVTVIGNFTVKVNIYNSAGEVVKTITTEEFSQPINNITLSTTNTITTLNGPGSSIEILYDGYVIGVWDGTNNLGQPVSNGQYKVQIDNVANSGVVTSVSEMAVVNRSLADITAYVYNSAGEQVRTLYNVVDNPIGSSMTNVVLSTNVLRPTLSAPTSVLSPTNANLAEIYIQNSGNPVTLIWDGTNNGGAIVSPGQYTIEVHWNNGSGSTTDISREILVMANTGISGIAVAEPNVLTTATGMTTTFNAAGVMNAAGIKVKIYAITGELVQSLVSSTPQATWSASGLASGIYIANVEIDNAGSGMISQQRLKILVLH